MKLRDDQCAGHDCSAQMGLSQLLNVASVKRRVCAQQTHLDG